VIALLPSFPGTDSSKHSLQQFISRCGVPVVDLCDQLPHLPFARVLPDNEAIGQLAAEHLISRGFQHFAFFTLDRAAPVVQGRMAGFRAAVKNAGRTFYLMDYTAQMVDEKSRSDLLPWLGKKLLELPHPLATMAQFDCEANDIVRACQFAGLRVPEDVAVVGADNDSIYAELGPVPLSSVVTNREMIGYRGAELLGELMQGGKVPRKPIRIKPDGVIIRKSSDVVAVAEEHVAKAVMFIQGNFRRPITVDDVVAASGASRRSLYAKFATHVGHSIQREILRQRLEHARHRLRDDKLKLQTVAEECGFEDASQLSKLFKHYLGFTIVEFRREHQAR
jgi:LacI family transcriptional regulator